MIGSELLHELHISHNYATYLDTACTEPGDWERVAAIAQKADLIIYVGGISEPDEHEGHDRDSILMPPLQRELFDIVYKASINGSKPIPIISVLCFGAPVINENLIEKSVAVLGAGYGGEMIGDAVVSLLNGSYVPSGRTVVTWYLNDGQLPPIDNYDMTRTPGRTYKFLTEAPLFPFGYGLSYTTFKYSNLKLDNTQIKPCKSVMVTVDLMNNGSFIADESVLVYMNVLNKTYSVDNVRLVNFTRVEQIGTNQQITVSLEINPRWMTVVEKYYMNELIIPGVYQVQVGNNLKYNANTKTFETSLKANFTIVGDPTDIKSCS